MTTGTKVRLFVACFGLGICFIGFGFRLVQLQLLDHDKYASLAAEKHCSKQVIGARRGKIEDAHGETIAENEPLRDVVADASLIKEGTHSAVAHLLAGPLGISAAEIQEKIATNRKYIVLKRRIPELVARDLMESLRKNSLRGITFEQSSRRVYPNGTMLSHVVGFVNSEHQGVQGIELTANDFLRGSDGFRYIESDRTGREIVAYRGQERAPRDGCSVRLTIDMGLQNIVETELDAAVKQYKPKAAIAILMRPQTGEILAMANRPAFDPNDVASAAAEQMKNRAVIDMVEPGSTFKIVTAAAAINEGRASLDTMIYCHNGSFSYGGRALRDHHGYGDLSVEDILAKSSNIGSALLAMKLGDERLYEYVRRFGFGERTGVLLPGEINGVVHPPHRWSKISITRIPMGHEVAVTPLQIVSAMCVIANGGRLMMPQIIHDVVDADGNEIQRFDPVEVRRVIEPETAASIRRALTKVVSKFGTAALAKVPGFSVAGKTGTAQKVDPKGGYTPGKYVVSFVGFMPAEDPQFAALVMLDDAATRSDLNYGGLVAAPIFRQIGEKAARYLNLVPSVETPEGQMILTKTEQD